MSELREKAIEEVLAKVRGYDRADIEAALRHCEPMDSEVVCCVEAVEGRLLAEQQRDQARELLRDAYIWVPSESVTAARIFQLLAPPAADAKGGRK